MTDRTRRNEIPPPPEVPTANQARVGNLQSHQEIPVETPQVVSPAKPAAEKAMQRVEKTSRAEIDRRLRNLLDGFDTEGDHEVCAGCNSDQSTKFWDAFVQPLAIEDAQNLYKLLTVSSNIKGAKSMRLMTALTVAQVEALRLHLRPLLQRLEEEQPAIHRLIDGQIEFLFAHAESLTEHE